MIARPFLVLALFALLVPAAAGAGLVQVTLQVGEHYHLAPAARSCAVTVPEGAGGAAVLDAAVATGCLASWSAIDYGAPGAPDRFVQCIDGRCSNDPNYWVFSHTQATPAGAVLLTTSYGIDDPRAGATAGAVYDFRYANLVAFFLP